MRGMVCVPGPFVLVLFGSDLFKSCVLQDQIEQGCLLLCLNPLHHINHVYQSSDKS